MKFITTILILTALFITKKITAQTKTITVTVSNISSNQGKVSYALFDKKNFRKKPLKVQASEIIENKSNVSFKNVAEGEYAIICFHDKNNNNKMDFEPNGMPMEDYGISNNKINVFGPPEYEQAKFIVTDKDVSLKIRF